MTTKLTLVFVNSSFAGVAGEKNLKNHINDFENFVAHRQFVASIKLFPNRPDMSPRFGYKLLELFVRQISLGHKNPLLKESMRIASPFSLFDRLANISVEI